MAFIDPPMPDSPLKTWERFRDELLTLEDTPSVSRELENAENVIQQKKANSSR